MARSRASPEVKRELVLAVDPALYPHIRGSSDTETFFFLALTFGLEQDPPAAVARAVGFIEAVCDRHGIAHPMRMSVAVSDGQQRRGPFAIRARACRLPSIILPRWRRCASSFPTYPIPELSDRSRLIVSEPLGELAGAWNEVPASTFARSGRGRTPSFRSCCAPPDMGADGLARAAAIFARHPTPPCAATLGWRLVGADPDAGTIRIGFEGRAEFLNPSGFVQGGFLAAMLDDTMGPAVLVHSGGALFTPTISLNVDFIAPARAGLLIGDGRIVHIGKSIAFLEGSLFDQSGALVARATATARLVPIAKAMAAAG